MKIKNVSGINKIVYDNGGNNISSDNQKEETLTPTVNDTTDADNTYIVDTNARVSEIEKEVEDLKDTVENLIGRISGREQSLEEETKLTEDEAIALYDVKNVIRQIAEIDHNKINATPDCFFDMDAISKINLSIEEDPNKDKEDEEGEEDTTPGTHVEPEKERDIKEEKVEKKEETKPEDYTPSKDYYRDHNVRDKREDKTVTLIIKEEK